MNLIPQTEIDAKLTVANFRKWLKTLPAGTKINIHSTSGCIGAQFFKFSWPERNVSFGVWSGTVYDSYGSKEQTINAPGWLADVVNLAFDGDSEVTKTFLQNAVKGIR